MDQRLNARTVLQAEKAKAAAIKAAQERAAQDYEREVQQLNEMKLASEARINEKVRKAKQKARKKEESLANADEVKQWTPQIRTESAERLCCNVSRLLSECMPGAFGRWSCGRQLIHTSSSLCGLQGSRGPHSDVALRSEVLRHCAGREIEGCSKRQAGEVPAAEGAAAAGAALSRRADAASLQ